MILQVSKRASDPNTNYVVRDIADAGADFITSHLRLEDVFCYWKSLLLSYTALLDYTVARDPSLSEVKPRKL